MSTRLGQLTLDKPDLEDGGRVQAMEIVASNDMTVCSLKAGMAELISFDLPELILEADGVELIINSHKYGHGLFLRSMSQLKC